MAGAAHGAGGGMVRFVAIPRTVVGSTGENGDAVAVRIGSRRCLWG